jgi:hypothetical protein
MWAVLRRCVCVSLSLSVCARTQGYLSWWNDNISYVLRGCIILELSLRGRIDFTKDTRRRALGDRIIEVVDRTVRA